MMSSVLDESVLLVDAMFVFGKWMVFFLENVGFFGCKISKSSKRGVYGMYVQEVLLGGFLIPLLVQQLKVPIHTFDPV